MILTNVALKAMLLDMVQHATAGPVNGALDGLKIALFTNVPDLTGDSAFADVTEPTYTGYAEVTITWGPVVEGPNGTYEISSQLTTWQMGDAALPTQVKGAALVKSGSPNVLYGAEVFGTPVHLTTVDDAVKYVLTLQLPNLTPGSGAVLP